MRSTGASVTPAATTAADLASLFDGAGTCKLTSTTTQGPYYFDADKIRSDIREDKQGVLTTQLMFDEKLNSAVMAKSPYSEHAGRDMFNDNDNIYDDSMLMKIFQEDDGYLGAIVFSADSDKDGA
ncbi:hypothetical protein ACIBO5_32670 [Nonomuraea angiospora]|uniref:hypothetical protein n=1 Tax=Nonomuraea angiospora TaxID=46172 RepID=UPI0037ADDDCB